MDAHLLPRLRHVCLTICALTSLAVAGCKNNGGSELLERELRRQEDCIYHLENELDSASAALDAARRENQSLKKEMAGGDRGAGSQFAPPSVTGPPSVSTPSGPSSRLVPPKLEVPDIEVPKFDGPPSSTTPHDPNEPPPLFKPMSHSSTEETTLTGDATKITKLVLNRQLTGGWNPHHGRCDEGLFVAFEPRDSQNRLVEAAADVSIVAIDPTQSGATARVARWDFTADETALLFRKSPFGKGFQFELPWPSEPPKTEELRVFVRLTTPDNRKVEIDSKVRINPSDQEANGWAPKPVHKLDPGPRLEIPATHQEPTPAKRSNWSPTR